MCSTWSVVRAYAIAFALVAATIALGVTTLVAEGVPLGTVSEGRSAARDI